MITKYEYLKLKERYKNGYRWITRDSCESIYVYKLKPVKQGFSWKTSTDDWPTTCGDDFLFPNVKWEDEEPTKIDDLIRDYESHQAITGGNNLNKEELIKEIEDILYNIGIHDYRIGERHENYDNWGIDSKNIRKILSAIEKCSLDDEKVVIPSFVADWIEEVKGLKRNFKLEYLFDTAEMPDDVYDWLDERYGDTDILAKAWLDGYEVEKEKLYTVQLKNGYHLCKYEGTGVRWLNMTEFNTADCYKLTQSEIESVDPRLMQFAVEVE